jgi:PAS domain S-box-containing protein
MNIMVTVIDKKYRYEAANDGWFRAMGKEPSQVIGETVARVWGRGQFLTVMKAKLDSCFAGVEIRDELWIDFPGLGRRYCEVLYWPHPLGGEGFSRVTVIYNDVTEQKTMEEHLTESKEAEGQLKAYQGHLERLVAERTEALKKSEEKYRNIFEGAVEGIFQSTPQGRFLSANPALAAIFGFDSPEELIASIHDIAVQLHVSPEKRAEWTSIVEREGVVRDFEHECRSKDGTVKLLSLNARAVRDKSGRILCYEGTVTDIAERKRAEEALRQAEEKYHNIFLNATEGIFQIRPDGGFLSVNPAFARIHAYDSAEDLTEHLSNVKELHASVERRAEYMGVLYGQGYVHNFEFRTNRKDGSLAWVSVNAKVVRDERGTILYHEGTVQDIEERKRAEEALEIKSRSLEEANTALKVLLKHREEDRRELEERFLLNVKQLVLPYVEKLKKGRLDTVQQTSVDFLEANLKEIVSPFLNNIRGFNFTPRQTEIIALIRDGKTTKEIAEFLHVGKGAVDIQRFLIRKRLGLNRDKANLRSYLLSLS